jgi:imidazolonepropionase-like amidohydrolase
MVTRRHLLGITAAAVMAQRTADAQSEPQVLFSNVRVFDGISPELSAPRHVMVRGNLISELSETPLSAGAGTTVIDGGGRTLMPGLIDAHVHMAMSTLPIALMMTADPNYSTLRTGRAAEEMLQRGFTSVRDLGGPTFGLKRAIDEGFIAGPRIWPCGATISQTSGHGDFRLVSDLPRSDAAPLHATERYGYAAIADGVPEVLRRVREQLMQGASQIKIMAGGGISSPADPLEGTQFSEEELRAACQEAEAANLYAMAHAYSPRAVTRAVRAGVRSIEHGNLIDAATAKVMKAEGAFLVPTLATYEALADEGERLGWSAAMMGKLATVAEKGIDAVRIAAAEGVPVVFGTDLLGHMHERQPREFALRAQALSPVQVLQSATITAAQLMRQEGQLGELMAGAHADLLVVEGDPTQELSMFMRPAGLRLIVQGGRVVKNTLA